MYVKRNYTDDNDMFQTTLENVEMAKQSFKTDDTDSFCYMYFKGLDM